MRLHFLAAVIFLTITPVRAQIGIFSMPTPPQSPFTQLKAYLNLTDAQVQALQSIQVSRNNAQQAIYKQINEKQMQLNALLSEGTSDALTVGQLEIDINNLRKQLPLPNSSYRTQALAVLDPGQTAKLAGLISALQLQLPAWQAITLDLIDAPGPTAPPPSPVVLPTALELTGGLQASIQ